MLFLSETIEVQVNKLVKIQDLYFFRILSTLQKYAIIAKGRQVYDCQGDQLWMKI